MLIFPATAQDLLIVPTQVTSTLRRPVSVHTYLSAPTQFPDDADPVRSVGSERELGKPEWGLGLSAFCSCLSISAAKRGLDT